MCQAPIILGFSTIPTQSRMPISIRTSSTFPPAGECPWAIFVHHPPTAANGVATGTGRSWWSRSAVEVRWTPAPAAAAGPVASRCPRGARDPRHPRGRRRRRPPRPAPCRGRGAARRPAPAGRRADARRLMAAAERHVSGVPSFEESVPGDLVLFRFRPHLAAKHAGILARLPVENGDFERGDCGGDWSDDHRRGPPPDPATCRRGSVTTSGRRWSTLCLAARS